jgi:manganese-dependent inorganic pyrophosphatase
LLLASPTTTKRDHIIVERLMELVRKSGILPYKDHKEFGDALFSVSSSLSVLSPDKIVTTDLKLYNMNEKQFGLAQIEVGNLNELGPRVKEISEALEELCESKGLEFAVLMVTDVVRANSRLVVAGNQALLKDLPYTPLADHTMDATGIVSRKKQLLPVILGFLE